MPADQVASLVLCPVPAGTYDLVLTASGRATAVMTDVPVVAHAITAIRATQAVAGGPTILAASTLADADVTHDFAVP